MHRRQFLQNVALAATGSAAADSPAPDSAPICEFSLRGTLWKVYEAFETRTGSITFAVARNITCDRSNATSR